MLGRLLLRRTVAQLALGLILLASLQTALGSSVAHGARRFIDLSAGGSFGDAAGRHDHAGAICHSCPGHICLEQHNVLDQAPLAPAILPGGPAVYAPWPAGDSFAHPPTAPPQPPFLTSAARPRAPPLSPPKSSRPVAAVA